MEKGSQYGFNIYLLNDKGYSLLPWIITPHKKGQHHSILKFLYNKKHKHIRFLIENAFGILKKASREILSKIELDITLVLDIFTYCCFLQNLILSRK
jgi:hypothetical protein